MEPSQLLNPLGEKKGSEEQEIPLKCEEPEEFEKRGEASAPC